MSGYGGTPPPGWEDPYGGSPGWSGAYGPPGAGPYGPGTPPPGYGPGHGPGYGPGYGPPGVPHAPISNGTCVAALVCNIVAVLLCCNIVAIPGIVTAAIAMGRVHTDPRSARRLTTWSWCLFAASVVIGIIVGVLYFVLIVNAGPDYGTSPDGV